MLQSFLTEPGIIRIEQAEIPVPREGEVLIRMQLAGICGSDVQLFRKGHNSGTALTIGHEGIGLVEGTGRGVSGDRMGQRVVIEPNIPCMHCPECLGGRGNICRNKRIIGVSESGCFAEYLALPAAFAHPLPESVSDADAVTIEPLAVALAALNRSHAKPGDPIAVIGLGTIGMLLTRLAISLGYRVLVSEPVESKRLLARELGALPVSSEKESGLSESGAVAVFECAGTGASASLAIESAPRGAEILLLGLSDMESTFRSYSLLRKGNRIVPSLIYDHPFDFRRAITLVENGTVSPGKLVSSYYSLPDLALALEQASSGKEGKIVIRIPGT